MPVTSKPGAAEGLQGEEALGAVRVRRDSDDHRAVPVTAEVLGDAAALAERLAQATEVGDEDVEQPERRIADLHWGVAGHVGGGQVPLEGADQRPAVGRRGEGVEATHQPAGSGRDHRGVEIMGVVVGVEERDDGVVAPVGVRHDRPSSPEVDAQIHGASLTIVGPPRPDRTVDQVGESAGGRAFFGVEWGMAAGLRQAGTVGSCRLPRLVPRRSPERPSKRWP
jgi:hypothetical protein